MLEANGIGSEIYCFNKNLELEVIFQLWLLESTLISP